ncbi:RNA-directed DNA polymerase, eukaryota, Reverse transcriptase zinc-binding domain protein [Artemisia annua]|uniref:RNA-directed DNA polymerase, eukaryota, Reverse transcriptase zinc-binding domain protein n=1 Tax=Artemisia annua TaxID=35608 RepID=A0A2U1MLV5_ARTAN|nr:RNA-directed DNA polymerase, eukaryota, Reverse transcriptase zinc-binding domain protein [Artemisia annua]
MQESEDLEHLFFNCEFSRGVWDKIKNKAGIHVNDNKLGEIVLSLANGKNGNNIGSVVKRLCFATSVYSIWFERNNRIFRDEKKEAEDVVKTILDTVKLKLMCLKVKDSGAVRLIERTWDVICKK